MSSFTKYVIAATDSQSAGSALSFAEKPAIRWPSAPSLTLLVGVPTVNQVAGAGVLL